LLKIPHLNAFISCANDSKIKLWSLAGDHLLDFNGHIGFINAVDVLESGEIVSVGDDCTIRVWNNIAQQK